MHHHVVRTPLAGLVAACLAFGCLPGVALGDEAVAPVVAPAADGDDPAVLKREIEALRASEALHERQLLLLERRLEAVEGGDRAAPDAAFASGGEKVLPASSGQTSQRRQESVDATYLQQNALFRPGLAITPTMSQSYATSRFFTLNGFLALGAIFLGNADVSQQKSSQTALGINTTYGLNSRVQFDLNVPYVHRTTTFSSVGAGFASNQASEATVDYGGLGDISGGVFYQVQRERGSAPNIVANLQFSAPTGRGPFGIKNTYANDNTNLIYPSQLPTGQGVWGLSAGVSVIKSLDPVVLYGGGEIYYYLPRRFPDISADATTVVPGYAQPGAAVSVNFGTAFALNDRLSVNLGYQQILSSAVRMRPAGSPWQKVVGTALNAGMLMIGTTYTTSDRRSWTTQLGIGVTQDAPNVQLNVELPYKMAR